MTSTYKAKTARNSHKGRSKGQPVAGNAVKGKPNRKKALALQYRMVAFLASKEGKSAGGHEMKKPGSMQGHAN